MDKLHVENRNEMWPDMRPRDGKKDRLEPTVSSE